MKINALLQCESTRGMLDTDKACMAIRFRPEEKAIKR